MGRAGAYLRRNALGLLALFIALGGTSYALASASGANAKLYACVNKKSGAARFVKKGKKCHHGEHLVSWNKQGPQGVPGAPGEKGNTGQQGSPGIAGPAGAASKSATIAGPLTTGSSSAVDLGGPTVTVNVGPSGLVAYWAKATLGSSGGGTAEVILRDPTGSATQMQVTGGAESLTTLPASDSGTHLFNGGLSTEWVGPGEQTFSLEYDDTGGTGTFSDIELVVIPL